MAEFPNIPIGEVATVRSGYAFKSSDWKDFGTPVVKIANVKSGRLNMEGCSFVDDNVARDAHEFQLMRGDILIAMTGYIGEVAVVREADLPALLNQRVGRFSIRDEKKLDRRFLYYAVTTPSIRQEIEGLGYGSAQPNVSPSLIQSVQILLPPIACQQAIASVLGALDDKIELNRRMNETLEAMARAIFKDWFVDFGPTRAKMAGRAPYLAPDIWSLFPNRLDEEGKPEGWGTEAVYEQAVWVNGAAYKDMHFSSEPDALPVVKIAELKSGITKTTRFTNTDLGERYKIRDGELLFSWSGNPDTSIDTFVWTSGMAWLNQHIFAVRPNGKRSQAFLYAMLKFLRRDFAEIARNKQTTGLGHVTQQDLIRLKITAPSLEAAAAFDEIVRPLHARFTSNLFENQSLAYLRDFLLPKLMSGEVRVKDGEKLVRDAT